MGWFSSKTSSPAVSSSNNQCNNNEEDESVQKETRNFVEGKDGLIVWEPETNPDVVNAVEKVRSKFLEEAELNSDLYIQQDIQMIKQHDYFIRRFLYPNDMNPEGAYEQFRTWMAWRKEVGFENASPQRFPMEFYQIGALFPYGTDKDGTLLLYMRFKVYKRLAVLVEAIQQFIIYNINCLDFASKKERGWAVIFDTQGAGVAQIDFDMLIFLVRTVRQYYPWGMKYVCVYELPWILQGGWKITYKLLPQDATRLFRFYNQNNITELIDPENLPDFMGGTCVKDYCEVPEGARCAEEVAAEEYGMTPDEVASVKKHFEKHFAEIEKRKASKLNNNE